MATVTKKKVRIKKSILKAIFRWQNFFCLLSLILSFLFFFSVIHLDMLPHKFVLLLGIWILFVNLLSIVFANFKKKIVFRIIGWIIIVLSILLSIVGMYYIDNTREFMDFSFTNKKDAVKTTYYVLVKSNSNLIKEKISGKVGLYNEMIYLDDASKKLSSKYSVEFVPYEDIGLLVDSLNQGVEQFILIEKTSYELVFSISESLKKEDYMIIYEYDIYTKQEATSSGNIKKFNVYVGGTDFAGLMDFNMIVTVNSETHTILLTNIPRDYYIPVAGKGGRYDKLSFMKVHGENVNRDSLADYLETPIDYTLTVNTSSLVTIVDYLGGIEFCSDYEYTTTHALVQDTYNDYGKKKLHVVKGCQHLNGIETLTVSRERMAFPGSDQVRQENCQKILLSIIKKLMSTDTLIHYRQTLNTLSSLYETDIPADFITQTAKDILNHGNQWKIETQLLMGNDSKGKVYLSNLIDWIMIPDEDTVTAAKAKIKETLA